MDKLDELLEEKAKEFGNMKAPDCLEEKLREALDKKGTAGMRFKVLKIASVAATFALIIGIGSLNYIDFSKNKSTQASQNSAVSEYGKYQGGEQNKVGVTFFEGISGAPATAANSDNQVTVKFNKDVSTAYTKDSIITTINDQTAPADSGPLKGNSSKKIIKNAGVTIEAKKAEDAFNKILKWVNSNGGYEFSRNIYYNGTHKQVEAVFKISPDKLELMLEFLKGTGKIIDSNTTSSDITEQYQDSAARLNAMKKARDQILVIMKKANTINDILKVQDELNKVNSDIEALQGSINLWDRQLAESSVNLVIYEQEKPLNVEEKVDWKFDSPGDVFNSMKNGFIKTTKNIINALIWLVVFICSALPAVLVLCAAGFFIWRYVRKRRK